VFAHFKRGTVVNTHEIVIDAKLVFEVEANHEVVATSQALIWLCDALAKSADSPLKAVGFNVGEKQE
jgi:hypothetical protein